MKKRLLVASLVLWSGVANAALPPYYQSVREMKSILENSKIARLFTSGRTIQSIAKTANGYEVTSADCRLEVEVKYIPHTGGRVGPIQFELVIPDFLDCVE